MASDIRLQSALGDISKKGRSDIAMNGMITLGKILKVHHKNHTADVQLIGTSDIISGSEATQGINACRIMERHAGWDSFFKVSYGNITPVQEGEIVAVGFLDNLKSKPIILGSFFDTDNSKNPLPVDYPLFGADEVERYEHLFMDRLQDYSYLSGTGEFEMVHHSRAYITSSEKALDDSRDGFNYNSLKIKSKNTKSTVGLTENQREFKPLDILVSLCDKINDVTSGLLRLFVSAKTGSFRITKDTNSNKLSMIEMQSDGTMRVKQQLDTYKRDKSTNYSEVRMNPDGGISVVRNLNGSVSSFQIGQDGSLTINCSKAVSINSDVSISLSAPIVSIPKDKN